MTSNPPQIAAPPARGRRGERAPTIHDVALAAGVSKSAVSLAIRNQRGVSESTREHILSVAADLGYRSNIWARSLVRGRTGLIGVLLQDLGHSYYRDAALGIEEVAAAAELGLVLAHGHREHSRTQRELESLLALGVDGLIVVSSHAPSRYLETVSRRLPVVVLGQVADPVPGVDTVSADDAAGGRLAAEHLAGLGHTRLAHLTGSAQMPALHRQRAFVQAARTLTGLDAQVEGPAHPQAAIKYLLFQLAEEKAAPTAVFAEDDRLAAQLMSSCVDVGMILPEQLSIIGYEDSHLCPLLRPQLSSIAQPTTELGRAAMHMLTERMGGRSSDQQLSIPPQLKVRGSTAPPA